MLAAGKDRLEIVKLLLQRQSRVDIQDHVSALFQVLEFMEYEIDLI